MKVNKHDARSEIDECMGVGLTGGGEAKQQQDQAPVRKGSEVLQVKVREVNGTRGGVVKQGQPLLPTSEISLPIKRWKCV